MVRATKVWDNYGKQLFRSLLLFVGLTIVDYAGSILFFVFGASGMFAFLVLCMCLCCFAVHQGVHCLFGS